MSLAGALIAGGASSRFGSSKAELSWKGRSLAGHLLEEMQAAGLTPLVLNAAQAFAGLPADVQVVPDGRAGQGPLEGLATVLRQLQRPVLICACDMPGLDRAAFQALAAAWSPGLRGLVTRSADGWHPLFGIYGPALLPAIESRLALGQRALHRLIEDEKLDAWEAAQPAWLVNVNTPEDWEIWRSRHAESNG